MYFTSNPLSVEWTVTDSASNVPAVWADWLANGPLDAGSVFDAYGNVFSSNLSGAEVFTNQQIYGDDYFASVRSGGINLRADALYASSATTLGSFSEIPYYEYPTVGSDFYIVWQNSQTALPTLSTPYKIYVSSSAPRYRGFYSTLSTDDDLAIIQSAWYLTTGTFVLAVTATGKDQPIYVVEEDTAELTLVTTVPDGETKIVTFSLAEVGVVGQGSIDDSGLLGFEGIASVTPTAIGSVGLETLLTYSTATHSIGARGVITESGLLPFSASAFNASLEKIGSTNIFYTMELTIGGSVVEAPISSWQATLQTGRQSYAQCVIPAVAPFVSSINAASTFTIYRQTIASDGTAIKSEMLTSPINSRSFSRGPNNYTCTISGYSDAFSGTGSETPIQASGVRSITDSNGSFRLRCDIDWVLRPNNVIAYDGVQFTVAFINYYVNARDQYMDVGDR